MKALHWIIWAWKAPALAWSAIVMRVGLLYGFRLRIVARLNGTRLVMGGAVRQEHPVMIQGLGELHIDSEVVFGFKLAGASENPILLQPRIPSAKIKLGTRSQIMNGCELFAMDLIEIGPDCLIGPGCLLLDSDGHQIHPKHRHEVGNSAPIILEENVWLGARVTILKGVRIGKDAIIASGSIVTKNVPAGAIAAGNPSRIVGSVYD